MAKAKVDPQYGKVVIDGALGGTIITIYEKGYISWGLLKQCTPQKLVAIRSDANIQKKAAVGRILTGAATFGLSFAANNQRGDLYLTIITDQGVKSIRHPGPSVMAIQMLYKLEMAGQAVIAQRDGT